MLHVEYTSQFKRDLKLAKKRKKNLDLLYKVMRALQYQETLKPKLKDHALTGNLNGYRELHIEPDWLLIYKIISKNKTLIFVRLGTHSDLFK